LYFLLYKVKVVVSIDCFGLAIQCVSLSDFVVNEAFMTENCFGSLWFESDWYALLKKMKRKKK